MRSQPASACRQTGAGRNEGDRKDINMQKQTATTKKGDTVLWANIILFGVVLLFFFYYIMTANSITAKSYKIRTLRDKVEALSETNSALMSKKIAVESQANLIKLAKDQSLVEARSIVYIFENKNVAKK